jgi:hypothetical protein
MCNYTEGKEKFVKVACSQAWPLRLLCVRRPSNLLLLVGPVGNFFLARCEPNYSPPSNLGELEKFYTLMPADRYFIARHVATGLLAAGIVVILY